VNEKFVCTETMVSMADPTHTHYCSGHDEDGNHFCPECMRWWWQAPKKTPTRKRR
jgi:hypothetical protein